jgi:hypothetical protein
VHSAAPITVQMRTGECQKNVYLVHRVIGKTDKLTAVLHPAAVGEKIRIGELVLIVRTAP